MRPREGEFAACAVGIAGERPPDRAGGCPKIAGTLPAARALIRCDSEHWERATHPHGGRRRGAGLCVRVMSESQRHSDKPGLDADARAFLGRQLRNYYDQLRYSNVSDALAQLLYQFETGTIEDRQRTGAPVDTAPQDRRS